MVAPAPVTDPHLQLQKKKNTNVLSADRYPLSHTALCKMNHRSKGGNECDFAGPTAVQKCPRTPHPAVVFCFGHVTLLWPAV